MNTSSAPIDVVTIGNATVDAFLTLQDDSSSCRLDPASSELCVTYGQKIPLAGCEFHVGGNAANVAVGLSRAGYASCLLAEIGEDEFAAKITNTLAREGVDLSRVQQKGQSSFAIGLQFQGERTLFVQHQTRKHEFSFENLHPKLVYLTSIGNAWESAYQQTLRLVSQTACMLAFNPGTLQIQKGKDSIKEVLARADIIFLNKEETAALLSLPDGSVTDLLTQLRRETQGLLVITNGKEGAYAMTKEGTLWHIDGMEVTIVEKTGAGDAFASGFLTGFLTKKSVAECLQYGSLNAAGVMGSVGAQAGLLRAQDYAKEVQHVPQATQI